eukprot:5016270-Pyramimonas_sp.AAC.1
MTKEKLQRGLPYRDASSFKRLKDLVRRFLCQDMGHFSRDCPKRTKPPRNGPKEFATKPRQQGQRKVRLEAVFPVLTAQSMIEDDEILSEVDVPLAS